MKTGLQHLGHYEVIIIGAGQSGLATSYFLQKQNISHLLIEKNQVMHTWKDQRWDSFCLVTPNWQCALPGHNYSGDDAHGFMVKDEIISYLDAFAKKVNAPVVEQTTVKTLFQAGSQEPFVACLEDGYYSANQVVIASGAYHQPIIPAVSKKLPEHILQIHSGEYKNSQQLPDGAVLVVGAGQSGAQIAEDLHLEDRKVHMALGNSPRVARFYRGRDVVDWLEEMNYYDMPVEKHPLREGVRDNTNHYVTGRDGGRDIDLRKFALEGMQLHGVFKDFQLGKLHFSENLKDALDKADETYNNILSRIDKHIEKNNLKAPEGFRYKPVWEVVNEKPQLDLEESGITSIIWCVGFRPDYSWCKLPIFDEHGKPQHYRGVCQHSGAYFIGLPWLHTWGSGRFSGVARDAEYIVNKIKEVANFSEDTLDKKVS